MVGEGNSLFGSCHRNGGDRGVGDLGMPDSEGFAPDPEGFFSGTLPDPAVAGSQSG